ncbi:MAG: hypothetical protein GTO41_01175, partial [Burkholderiales bacterium]|nr:hypothetical protein [Burkholderiales bacterium]
MNPTRNRIVLTVLLAGLSLLVTSANAANSNTLKVSATITGTCNFNSANNAAGNAELAFGTLDQTSTAAASAPAVAVNYWCTNGTAVSTFTAGNGLYTA